MESKGSEALNIRCVINVRKAPISAKQLKQTKRENDLQFFSDSGRRLLCFALI